MIQLLSAFAIVGLHNSIDLLLYYFTDKELSVYYDQLEGSVWQVILKPIIFCVYCMASVMGTFFYFTFASLRGLEEFDFYLWIPSLFVIAGLIKWIEK